MWYSGVHCCAGMGSGYGVGDAEFSEVGGEVLEFAVGGCGVQLGAEEEGCLEVGFGVYIDSCIIIKKA